jgi:hypothetical protein
MFLGFGVSPPLRFLLIRLTVSLYRSLQLCARWIVFTSPLSRVAQYQDEGALRGCVLCFSLDGTIAVILVDGFQL